MRITCPTCSTQYDVEENDIAFTGQDVQCTECMTVWTQARNGEATNPRLGDALAEDDEEFASHEEVEEEVDVSREDASVFITDEDTQDDDIAEPEDLEATPTEAETDDIEDAILEGETVESDDGETEDPIWKEIAALALDARADKDSESVTEPAYFPPDDMPPIQSAPVVPNKAEPEVDLPEDENRPWDVDAETEKGFSDFVWNDPSNETVDDDSADHEESDITPQTDTSDASLEGMNDDLIAAALNEQMAIEDALEDAPKPAGRDISDVPVELGGPRARVPNVEALKSSVRSKAVKLTSEELEEKVPARRFRRGIALILLIFVILGAIYTSRNTITEYVPALGPYLETYASFVDLLRAKSEVLGAYIWGLLTQGYDWMIVKFFS